MNITLYKILVIINISCLYTINFKPFSTIVISKIEKNLLKLMCKIKIYHVRK